MWSIIDYYIPIALLTIKQVSILTNVDTIIFMAEVYNELMEKNTFIVENILAFEQSPKSKIKKSIRDEVNITFTVFNLPKGLVEEWLKFKKQVELAGHKYQLILSVK